MPWKECQPRHSRQGGALLILAIKNALKMFTSENVLCMKRQLQLTALTHLLLSVKLLFKILTSVQISSPASALSFFGFCLFVVSCRCGSLESAPFSETVILENSVLMYYYIDFKTVQ